MAKSPLKGTFLLDAQNHDWRIANGDYVLGEDLKLQMLDIRVQGILEDLQDKTGMRAKLVGPTFDVHKRIRDKRLLVLLEEETKERLDDDALALAPSSWRLRERMKTSNALLVICLNIGTDPPDVVKTDPCARLECWVDPNAYAPNRASELVAKNLQSQFEAWQPRAQYKHVIDPYAEQVKKYCISLRKAAKDERVLFHFNGHGVPKPTANGEIWVFNVDYTQYIPLSVYQLRSWVGYPAIYTFDCSSAGLLLPFFSTSENVIDEQDTSRLQQHQDDQEEGQGQQQQQQQQSHHAKRHHTQPGKRRDAAPNECIVLAACGPSETLPSTPDFPADLFTSCLTTPIKIALRWFVMCNRTSMDALGITVEMVDQVPGKLGDRKTPLGELNWIFTAITDTIAWSVLPRHLFRKLFRQDILVASLFRNFLLAERMMKSVNCNPQSIPALPPTWQHHLWQAWDMAVENCLTQLPQLVPTLFTSNVSSHSSRPGSNGADTTIASTETSPRSSSNRTTNGKVDSTTRGLPNTQGDNSLNNNRWAKRSVRGTAASEPVYVYKQSDFFANQLTAFEVWLTYGENVQRRRVPEQLPIVLQVLLSSFHRQRALDLLARFLNLGSWAVSLALYVGIFPYVNKLLMSPDEKIRPVLIHIWSKILALDNSCQSDLVKEVAHYQHSQVQARGRPNVQEGGHQYFINQLNWLEVPDDPGMDVPRQKALAETLGHSIRATFVLSMITNGHALAQQLCLQHDILKIIRPHLLVPSYSHYIPILRNAISSLKQWICFLIVKLCERNPSGRKTAYREAISEPLLGLLQDSDTDIVQATILALGALIGPHQEPLHSANNKATKQPGAPSSTTTSSSSSSFTASTSSTFSSTTTTSNHDHPRQQQQQQQQQQYHRGVTSNGSSVSYMTSSSSSTTSGYPHTQRGPAGQQNLLKQRQMHMRSSQHHQQQFQAASQAQQQAERKFKEIEAVGMRNDCYIASKLAELLGHGSPVVRRELVLALARLVVDPRHASFVQLTAHELDEMQNQMIVPSVPPASGDGTQTSSSSQTKTHIKPSDSELMAKLGRTIGENAETYLTVWLAIKRLDTTDAFPAVSKTASFVSTFVREGVLLRIEAIRSHAGLRQERSQDIHSGNGADPTKSTSGPLTTANGQAQALQGTTTGSRLKTKGNQPVAAAAAAATTVGVVNPTTRPSSDARAALLAQRERLRPTTKITVSGVNRHAEPPSPKHAIRQGNEVLPSSPSQQPQSTSVGGAQPSLHQPPSATQSQPQGQPQNAPSSQLDLEDIIERMGLVSTLFIRRCKDFSQPSPWHSASQQTEQGWYHLDSLSFDGQRILSWQRRNSEALQCAWVLQHFGARWALVDKQTAQDTEANELNNENSYSVPQTSLPPFPGRSRYADIAQHLLKGARVDASGSFDVQSTGSGRSGSIGLPSQAIVPLVDNYRDRERKLSVPEPNAKIRKRLDKLLSTKEKSDEALQVFRDETWAARRRACIPVQVGVQHKEISPTATASSNTWYRGSSMAGETRVKLEQVAIFEHDLEMCSKILFHPFQPVLVLAGQHDDVSVWEYPDPALMQGGNAQTSSSAHLTSNLVSRFQNGTHYKGSGTGGVSQSQQVRGNSSKGLEQGGELEKKPRSGGRVTAMQWMNETSEPLLIVGSDDGKLRVWRDILSRRFDGKTNGSRLVTAWTALPELLKVTNAGPGLVFQYQQSSGHVICGGKTPLLSVWDLATEQEVGRVDTGSGNYTTCIASYGKTIGLGGHGVEPELDHGFQGSIAGGEGGDVFLVGSGDGALRVFDKRIRFGGRLATNVALCQNHRSWIVGMSVPQSQGGKTVLSGSVSGEIRIWDIRRLAQGSHLFEKQLDTYYRTRAQQPTLSEEQNPRPRPRALQPSLAFEAHRSPMTAFACHEFAPVFASGSHHRFIHLFNTNGDNIATIRYHDGFLRQRIGPVSSLAFHPYKMLLAGGAIDSIVSVYAPACSSQ